MDEMIKHGQVGRAARKADMDRKTARKYIQTGKLPSELVQPRTWRTRTNPFDAEDWGTIVAKLTESPELEAKTLFEWLMATRPGKYTDGQLRTLQRHVNLWRVAHGPDREVFFAQHHTPGEAAQTDFTSATELGVTINGVLYDGMFCVLVLPYSNWQCATLCMSESMMAMRKGVQSALFQLGHVPRFHKTDNSTAATHRIPRAMRERLPGKKRPFNAEYLALMRHFDMEPRTTAVGQKEQNGDVEASHGALKRRIKQALLLRGSRDFDSLDAFQAMVQDVVQRANANRSVRLAEELATMKRVRSEKLAEYTETTADVSGWSTIRVRHCAYSVPSRFIKQTLRVRIYDASIEVFFGSNAEPILRCARLIGHGLARIDYRHVIWSLVRKPRAFAHYVFREELFPSITFRRAYDSIQTPHHGTPGDLQYLRILFLAARTMESAVEAALQLLLEQRAAITSYAVRDLIDVDAKIEAPQQAPLAVDLAAYDALIREMAS